MQIPMIDEKNYKAQMSTVVLPALRRCREEGWMDPAHAAPLDPPASPGKLHYVCYSAEKFHGLNIDYAQARFRGAIVISHGFTEFAAKYAEMVWYFLLAGYSVCVFEHRGHGYSPRDVSDPSLVWIDDWHRYVDDLAQFCKTVGKEYASDQQLHLYAHSMGGGIGAALVEQYPALLDKAVLSSPMIAPVTGMPNWLTGGFVDAMCAVGFDKHIVPGHSEFTPHLDMAQHAGASEPRVTWYHELRCSDSHYQTYAATFGWVRQTLRLSRAVLRPDVCGRIETPIMLFQAGKDVWVLNEAEKRFVDEVRGSGGDIVMERIPDSVHEIFSMPNEVLEPYVHTVLDFFDTPALTVIGKDD
ncbi:MAG: alpha/beta hydrolase [Bifidobacterium sp.]|nr:alpha/beta hydrolase [Bifidobacterium sp.]